MSRGFSGRGFDGPSFGGGLTPGAKYLMIGTLAVLILEGIALNLAPGVVPPLDMTPSLVVNRLMLWQFVTATVSYGNPIGWLFGMLALYFFGSAIEARYGTRRFLTFYFVGGTITHLLTFLVALAIGMNLTSGGWVMFTILLGAFAALNWHSTIFVFPLPPMRGKTFAAAAAGIELLLLLFRQFGAIASLCGLAVGLLYVRRTQFRFYQRISAEISERLRLWRIRRKYRNFRVVDSDINKLWDEVEERLNKDDRNRRIH